MKKTKKFVAILALIALLVFVATACADKKMLRDNLIRLHVVANSDSQEDQSVKLQVRDAVLSFLNKEMQGIRDIDAAKAYLQQRLPQIQAVANGVLEALGKTERAVVTFLEEAFPTRDYPTFRLPAGIYESLRITIGQGQGENWWCVVFPSLCMQATSSQVKDTAAGAGFSDPLAETLTGGSGYRVRFFFLEILGRMESIFE